MKKLKMCGHGDGEEKEKKEGKEERSGGRRK